MRIALVIYDLDLGGAQKVMCRLAGWLADAGCDTAIFTMMPGSPFFEIDPKVKIVNMGGVTREGSNFFTRMIFFFKRFQLMRKFIKDYAPNAVISFVDEVNVRVQFALLGTGIPVVSSEHTYPPNHRIKPVYAAMRRLLYPRAAAVTVLTEKAVEWTRGWIAPEKVFLIPNPVVCEEPGSGEPDVELPPGSRVLSMGRVSREKGYDLLIDAFSRVANKRPGWSLVIVGDGDLLESLRAAAAEKGVADRVFFPGRTSRGAAVMRACDLYALSSRLEGFPVTLCEAMACGMPVISFDCDTGPRDVISHEENGLLVSPGDVDALAAALYRMMDDDVLRSRLGAEATKISARFSMEKVMGMWVNLLEKVTKEKT